MLLLRACGNAAGGRKEGAKDEEEEEDKIDWEMSR